MRQVAPDEIWELVEADIKCAGYAARQARHNDELSRKNSQRIPNDLNFEEIPALSSETRQRLSKVRPDTLGQAARVSGVPDLAQAHPRREPVPARAADGRCGFAYET